MALFSKQDRIKLKLMQTFIKMLKMFRYCFSYLIAVPDPKYWGVYNPFKSFTHFVLRCIARIILCIFPVEIDIRSKLKSSNVMFVANHQTGWGNFLFFKFIGIDILILVAAVYLETGMILRGFIISYQKYCRSYALQCTK
jgi:1-acyl-sn-glycerol-3-phosphate acyltransferase